MQELMREPYTAKNQKYNWLSSQQWVYIYYSYGNAYYNLHHNTQIPNLTVSCRGWPPLAEDSYWCGDVESPLIISGRGGTVQSRVCKGNHYTRMVMAPARNLAREKTTYRLRRVELAALKSKPDGLPTCVGG